MFMTDNSALANFEKVQLNFIWNPHLLRLLEDLMFLNFHVKHVSGKYNGVADYISRKLSQDCKAPDYPRLLRTYKPAVGMVRFVSEDKGPNYDYDLLKLAHQAADDREYSALVQAIKNRMLPPLTRNMDLSLFKSVV